MIKLEVAIYKDNQEPYGFSIDSDKEIPLEADSIIPMFMQVFLDQIEPDKDIKYVRFTMLDTINTNNEEDAIILDSVTMFRDKRTDAWVSISSVLTRTIELTVNQFKLTGQILMPDPNMNIDPNMLKSGNMTNSGLIL